MTKLSLADSLKKLRSDLEDVAVSGQDAKLKFLIDDVTLELQVTASSDAEVGGKVSWWIIGADAKGSMADSATQKLSLKLKVVDAITNQTAQINRGDVTLG